MKMKMKIIAESLSEFRLNEGAKPRSKRHWELARKLSTADENKYEDIVYDIVPDISGDIFSKDVVKIANQVPDEEIDMYLQRLNEGVADKYAAKKFGIQDEDDEFEKQYQQHKTKEKGETIAEVNGKPLIRNPKDLKSFPHGARGVITTDGNLYVATDTENTIHNDILEVLKKKGIIKTKTTGWEDPNDIKKFGFATVQRVWNKPVFAVGESYIIPKPKQEEERKQAMSLFKPFFEAAQKKNLNYKFIYNTPRATARKLLSADEFEEYKTMGS